MKKQIIAAFAASALIVSCTQSTTKTEKIENPDGSTTTTTVTESSTGFVDTAKVDKAKSDVKNTVSKTGEKINEAGKDIKTEANKVGKDIKSGAQEVGKDIKNTAATGAQKVEDAAKKLKEDLKK
jgi:predicted small secreted protein